MKMKNVLKKLLGGGVALALSMAMVLGIFVGMGMDAKAADEYEVVEISESDTFYDVLEKCVFKESDEESAADVEAGKEYIKSVYSSLAASSNGKTPYVFFKKNTSTAALCLKKSGDNYATSALVESFYQRSNNISWYLLKKKDPSPSNASNSEVSSTTHTHSYSWVTVQEANVGQDGIEEYRCSCGDVQGRSVIPASVAAVKGLFGEIKNAPQNGTATFDSGRLYTISDYVIKKLAERTDVTTVITFEYQNQAYKMTIPAGADFTSLLADEDYFYGYFFFANAVGATIEAIA